MARKSFLNADEFFIKSCMAFNNSCVLSSGRLIYSVGRASKYCRVWSVAVLADDVLLADGVLLADDVLLVDDAVAAKLRLDVSAQGVAA